MKTINDVLSFEDIQVYDDHLIELTTLDGFVSMAAYTKRAQFIDRWIHTFLEWDLYNEFIYYSGWTLEYISASQGNCNPVITPAKVNTLQEAEIMATEKISRYLGISIHLEQDEMVEGDLYKVMDNDGAYRGLIEIKAAS